MNQRPLGRTDLQVSSVGMGCNRLAESGPDAHWEDLVRQAADWGVTLFDTAEAYQKGASETILGQAIGHRPDVYIATKVGGSAGSDYSPQRIRTACEASLKRLHRDSIDIYQLHSPQRQVLEQGDWADTLADLHKAGKIRLRAVAIRSIDDGLWLIRNGLVEVLQVTYNLLETSIADELLPLALEKGVGLLGRMPLAQGVLTGKFQPDQPIASDHRASRAGEQLQKRLQRTEALKPLGAQYPGGLTRLAHHFSLSHPAISCIIPGARSREQLQQNIAAAQAAELTEEWRQRITQIQAGWSA